MRNTKKIATLALLLGGLMTFTAVGAALIESNGGPDQISAASVPDKPIEGMNATSSGEPSYGTTNDTTKQTSMQVPLTITNSRITTLDPKSMKYSATLSNGKTVKGVCISTKTVAPGQSMTVTIQFNIDSSDYNMTITVIQCSDSTGYIVIKVTIVIAPTPTPTPTHQDWFTDLSYDGFYPIERDGKNVTQTLPTSIGGTLQPLVNPDNLSYSTYNPANKTAIINAGQGYYFFVDADTQQAFIDSLKASGFSHENVWGNAAPLPNLAMAQWHMTLAGVTANDVIFNAGWGWPSMEGSMIGKEFTNVSGGIDAKLESVPSGISMSGVSHWGGGQWTDSDIVAANFPAKTPAAIQFQHAGTYTLAFYLTNGTSGEVMSPKLTMTVTVQPTSSINWYTTPMVDGFYSAEQPDWAYGMVGDGIAADYDPVAHTLGFSNGYPHNQTVLNQTNNVSVGDWCYFGVEVNPTINASEWFTAHEYSNSQDRWSAENPGLQSDSYIVEITKADGSPPPSGAIDLRGTFWRPNGGLVYMANAQPITTDGNEYKVETIPSYGTASMFNGMFTNESIPNTGPNNTLPCVIQIGSPGDYRIKAYVMNNLNGQIVSPTKTVTLQVSNDSEPTVEMNSTDFRGFMYRCITPGSGGMDVNATINQTVDFSFQGGQGLMDKNVTYNYNGKPWDGRVWAYITVANYTPGSFDSSLSFNETGVATLPSWNVFDEEMHTVNFTMTFHDPVRYEIGDSLGWEGNASMSYAAQGMCAASFVNVGYLVKIPPMVVCSQPRPWPSQVEIINQPASMQVNQTYEFQARIMVQNFNASTCSPTPMYYSTKTPIDWTLNNDQGQSFSYQCTTANDGSCFIDFQCPSAGNWTATAQWAGNSDYQASSGSVTINAT